jgi:DNA uptake protein ComE-like DNA-binding protein
MQVLPCGVGNDLRQEDQPLVAGWHRNNMHLRFSLSTLVLPILLGIALACTNQSPDQIRQKTAEETAAIKRDTKAVAQGVKDGLSNKKSVDLNKASKDDLASLPGISSRQADRIIAERPYANTHQLVSRHVLSEDEYAQVQDRVVVNP